MPSTQSPNRPVSRSRVGITPRAYTATEVVASSASFWAAFFFMLRDLRPEILTLHDDQGWVGRRRRVECADGGGPYRGVPTAGGRCRVALTARRPRHGVSPSLSSPLDKQAISTAITTERRLLDSRSVPNHRAAKFQGLLRGSFVSRRTSASRRIKSGADRLDSTRLN
jgi:hypothetical protein